MNTYSIYHRESITDPLEIAKHLARLPATHIHQLRRQHRLHPEPHLYRAIDSLASHYALEGGLTLQQILTHERSGPGR